MFRKKSLEKAKEQEIETIEHGYSVDREIGRFHFNTHRLTDHNGDSYNTATDLFRTLKGKEWYRTVGFNEIAIILGDVVYSYRKTTQLINRVWYQQIGGTPYRTLQANTETEGAQLIDYLENKTTNILRRHRFEKDGAYKGDPEVFGSCNLAVLPEQVVEAAAERISDEYSLSELLCNPVCFEDPTKSVNIAIDDVGVKRQNATRNKGPADSDKPTKRKYAYKTVARINQTRNIIHWLARVSK